MNITDLQELLKCLGALSALLLTGIFLRAKIRLFQRLLLPASVIGGFIGLLLGPIVAGKYAIFRFPDSWLSVWSFIPGILIIPIFAAIPLGMFMGEKSTQKKKKTGSKALVTLGLFAACGCIQQVIGLSINLFFSHFYPEMGIYRTFGWELAQGFTGGHGTAGSVGALLLGYNLDYWQTAQGVATTTATVGLIGGMLLGILFINRASKKGQTALLSKTDNIPNEVAKGFTPIIDKQRSIGRETTSSSSIDTITVHLGLLLTACLAAFGILKILPTLGLLGEAFSYIPVWFYALLVMYVINFVLIKFNLSWLIDTKVKSRITGTMTDFAIVAAIASLDIMAVATFLIPIAIMCVLGFIGTYLITFPLSKLCFKKDYAFERGIMSWGVNTGVMITGMMLLKICDPDYDTPVLKDFSLGFSMSSLITIVTSPLAYRLIAKGTTWQLLFFYAIQLVIFIPMALIASRSLRRGE